MFQCVMCKLYYIYCRYIGVMRNAKTASTLRKLNRSELL